LEHTDIGTAGAEAGTKSFLSLEQNTVNPTSCLKLEEDAS